MLSQRQRKSAEQEVSQRGLRDISVDFQPSINLMRLAWRQGRDHLPCITSRDRSLRGGTIVHPESFTAMVVADLLLDERDYGVLVRGIASMLEFELGNDEVFHFFKEHERLPADADCTALGLSVMIRSGLSVCDTAHRALDRIIANSNGDGVVETYFDPTGERDGIIDPIVCANVVFLALQLGRGDEVRETLAHIERVLIEESYLEGSRYYHSADTFLYFLGRVVRHFPETRERLLEPLQDAVRKRLGVPSEHTIDVAQRALLCAWLEIDDEGTLENLVDMREGDGCWPNDALFRYGRKKVYFGSRIVATAFAVRAIVEGKERRRVASPDAQERVEAEVVYGENVRYIAFG